MFRFAILGAGKIAGKFTEAARLAGCEIAAVAGRTPGKAKAFAEAHGIPAYYEDYAALLDAEKPDCAYIATVPSSHFEVVKLCMEKHIPAVCEKAMFVSSAQAKEAFALAEKNHTFLMEALWSKFLPANKAVKRWLDDGRIGKPVLLDAAIGFAAPDDDKNRYFSPELCGGAATDITCYVYEVARFMLGEKLVPVSVNAIPYHTGVDATDVVTLRAGDCLCTLRTTFLGRVPDGMTIVGTAGRIFVNGPHTAREAFLYAPDGTVLEHFTDTETKNGFVYEISEARSCIESGRIASEVCSPADTIACAELFDRIYAAMD